MNQNTPHTGAPREKLFVRIRNAVRSFSPKERVFFHVFLWLFVGSAIVLLWNVNRSFLVEVPADGGSFTEGVIGAPRFINPLLAVSDADGDLTSLIYAGLMRVSSDGTLVPDLAERYEISEDGLTYSFFLKKNIFFHDGTPITADDVIYTVTKAQDPGLKSPERASWEGVQAEKVSDTQVNFILKQPYAPFLENTTLGILPKHIWNAADPDQISFSQFNITPVGSGPYEVKTIKRDSSGIPEYYDLVPWKKYALGKPHISRVRIRFYANESELITALKKGDIESVNAISPAVAEELKGDGYNVLSSPLPRVFGVFFNQNQATLFTDAVVRKALTAAVDREKIVSEVLAGYGTPLYGPIPPGSFGYAETATGEHMDEETRIAAARGILAADGWKLNEETGILEKKTSKTTTVLSFSLSTSDVPELRRVGEILQAEWQKVGAKVELKVFEAGDLNQNVIRPRKYDALLFGEIVGRDADLFAFWHSSQRNDPGLNIALYANITADKALEQARALTDPDARIAKYREFETEITNDVPAIFLYAPDFIYVIPKKIKGVTFTTAKAPSERFIHVNEWYIETDNVWKIFAPDSVR